MRKLKNNTSAGTELKEEDTVKASKKRPAASAGGAKKNTKGGAVPPAANDKPGKKRGRPIGARASEKQEDTVMNTVIDFDSERFSDSLVKQMRKMFGITPAESGKAQMYKALCTVIKDILTSRRFTFKEKMRASGAKQVYYMSMEFFDGKSLKNHLMNLGLVDGVAGVLANLGFNLDELCAIEQDAGLGNGGLGRLAAAYMDALTSQDYAATGFSIRYDYGIFRQKIVDGWQLELPDEWLEMGEVWLSPRVEDTFEIRFGGKIDQEWRDDRLAINHKDYTAVLAVPYDMNVSGYLSNAVNTLRLWSAKAPIDIDLKLFSQGEYVKAMESKSYAESISKILYPADNHYEGKSLRLKQQYFSFRRRYRAFSKSI